MTPLRGWSPCGERLNGQAPFGHWTTSTFLAALRHDRIDAPWIIDGPNNGGQHLRDFSNIAPVVRRCRGQAVD
ncbi:MAG: hypothetical protein B7Y73_03800 [Acidocella sp. 35-58-6]|nr:MAG: hypothetical protein B7Y73_03800 [Acidocella sp. 35-58-6]